MDSERWGRIETLFHGALEREGETRRAYLARECGDDAEMRAEVESLLAAHERAGLLDEAGDAGDGEAPSSSGGVRRDAPPGRGPAPPERIGPYAILSRLGEGGMGTVYLARRQGEGFEQIVALKLLRPVFVDRETEERFAAERRILARLEHPGIARFIDGGVTEAGQPFYAMEYVEGSTLLAHADQRRLSVRERVRLFLEVCEPVSYAHRQLVVHRDLKPGNILVTPEGRVKLLDFGIAKLLDPGDGERAATRSALWATPAYASPEQVRGDPATTLSDVYALGVVLYELLTGVRPYRIEGSTPGEIERVVSQEVPRRPSTVDLGAEVEETRGTTSRGLRKALSGDLDTIVLKALAKEPERRYGSASELADDLRRHLEGRPVLARPDSFAYRLGRFVSRNRIPVAAAALVLLSLVTGLGVAAWQARRATREAEIAAAERDRAEEAAEESRLVAGLMTEIFRLSDPNETLGDTITAREVLDRGTERIERELVNRPTVQAALLAEVARVYENLGLLARAEDLVRRSLELRTGTLGASSPVRAASLVDLARLLAARGERAEAVERYREALAIREATVPSPDSLTARARADLAFTLRELGEGDEAARLFEEALVAQRALFGDEHPEVASSLLGLAATYHDSGRFDDADSVFGRVLASYDTTQGRPHPLAATALLNVGMIRRLRGQYAEAEPLLRSAVAMREAIYDDDHPDLVGALDEFGALLFDLGRYAEAERTLRDAMERASRSLGLMHPETRNPRETLAAVLSTLGRYQEAVPRYDTVLAQKREINAGADHPGIVFTLVRMAEPLRLAGRTQEASSRLEEATAMSERISGPASVYRALALREESALAARAGRRSEAVAQIRRAESMAREVLEPDHRYVREIERERLLLTLSREDAGAALPPLRRILEGEIAAYPPPHPRIALAYRALGEAHLAMGDPAEAERAFRAALDNLDSLPASHGEIGATRSALGAALLARGADPAEARPLLEEGYRILLEHWGAEAPETRVALERLGTMR